MRYTGQLLLILLLVLFCSTGALPATINVPVNVSIGNSLTTVVPITTPLAHDDVQNLIVTLTNTGDQNWTDLHLTVGANDVPAGVVQFLDPFGVTMTNGFGVPSGTPFDVGPKQPISGNVNADFPPKSYNGPLTPVGKGQSIQFEAGTGTSNANPITYNLIITASTSTPEPSTLLLLATGILGLVVYCSKR